MEVLPCARIAHIERAHKPYTEDLTSHMRRNALRVAEVWMDEFKSHVYMAWNIPMEVKHTLRASLHQLFENMIPFFLNRAAHNGDGESNAKNSFLHPSGCDHH